MESAYVYQRIVVPAVEGSPRNGEGDVVQLSDGRLLMIYGEVLSDSDRAAGDDAPGTLQGLYSEDRGRTWSGKHLVQENTGRCNVMSVSLLRLQNGEILLLFVRKNANWTDCHPFVRRSADEGRTWSAPEPVTRPPKPLYYCINNNRMIQLKSGRILVPACTYDNGVCKGDRLFFSDDQGRSWKETIFHTFLSESKTGPDEPGVIELCDGRVMMWCRSDLCEIYRCDSRDGGETFGSWQPTGLIAQPSSPASIQRLPSTGDLFCIFNDRTIPREYWALDRTPLTAAISSDEGENWKVVGDLEPDRTCEYCYTSVTFLPGNEVLLTYYHGRTIEDVAEGVVTRKHWQLSHLKVAIFKEEWLYCRKEQDFDAVPPNVPYNGFISRHGVTSSLSGSSHAQA